MIQTELVLAVLIALGSIFCLLNLLRSRLPGLFSKDPDNLKHVISSQSSLESAQKSAVASNSLLESVEEAARGASRRKGLSLQRKFRYAGWRISPFLFRGFEASISLLLLSLAMLKFNIVVQILALFGGPLIMHALLSRAIHMRFKAFDRDYPQFLMQVVGLLKTGMTAITAIQEAAKGLDPNSLVRKEVNLMVTRVRFGILEDRSIGAFAENIDHPEIELFVEALLLSRRLGGNLSNTLERIAVQVRKRQYFRSMAEASVALQRGSLWVIIVILVAIECYIALLYPDLVFKALETEIGWQVWQICMVLIAIGYVWIRNVTKFKI